MTRPRGTSSTRRTRGLPDVPDPPPGAAAVVADGAGGFVVVRDGHPQSHVDLGDPENLVFEYIALMAAVLDTRHPRPTPLRVTHVGGAGLTLPRWVAATRPGSPQIVLEPDAVLTELVRRDLPLPRGHRVRVRPVDGLAGVADLAPGSADVVVVDAYDGGRVPAELGTVDFLAACARVLGPGGTFLANVADEPGLRYAARVASGARLAFAGEQDAAVARGAEGARGGARTAYVTTSEVAKGRRFGNLVLVAAAGGVDEFGLRRAVATLPWSCVLVTENDLRKRRPDARPFTVEDAEPSPEPPDPAGARRLR